MKKFENIIFASDVDGTFASYKQPMAYKNIEALKYFKENGGRFCFATGRNHYDINTVVKCDHGEIAGLPYVLCNGTYLYEPVKNEIVDPLYLDAAWVKELFAAIHRDFPESGVRSTTRRGFLALDDDRTAREQLSRYGLESMLYTVSAKDFTGEGVFKIVLSHEDFEVVEAMRKYVAEKFGDVFSATRSTSYIVEVLPKGISKAYRLLKMRNEIKKENPDVRLFCIGDFDNDIEMLSEADFSFCPANACERVKAIAKKEVCHCNDGALAEAIQFMEKLI
ncbi:MAG: HAD-IIB family hydrolase [Eubacteriales bacterium]